MYLNIIKPFIDKLAALCVLIIASPVLMLCIIGLAIANKGSVWFLQPRPGKDGKIFRVVKFKTMTDERDSKGNLMSDQHRLTPFGSFIRKTSLDEIPQLINVLKGDMSIVGPRPLLVEYLPLYDKMQARRHEVKPGITGWAQVNGRNLLEWKKRFEYDVWYVDNASFALDMKILFMTIFKVAKSEGVSSTSSVTMEKFKGNH